MSCIILFSHCKCMPLLLPHQHSSQNGLALASPGCVEDFFLLKGKAVMMWVINGRVFSVCLFLLCNLILSFYSLKKRKSTSLIMCKYNSAAGRDLNHDAISSIRVDVVSIFTVLCSFLDSISLFHTCPYCRDIVTHVSLSLAQ